MDEVEKNLEENNIKVEIRLTIPRCVTGDDAGILAKYEQYLAPEEFSSFDAEFILLRTLEKMSRELTDKIVEKLNA